MAVFLITVIEEDGGSATEYVLISLEESIWIYPNGHQVKHLVSLSGQTNAVMETF